MTTIASIIAAMLLGMPSFGIAQAFDTLMAPKQQTAVVLGQQPVTLPKHHPTQKTAGSLSLKANYFNAKSAPTKQPIEAKSSDQQLRFHIENKSQISAQGGVDSGGGTFVLIDQQLGLLDLYLHNPIAFFDMQKSSSLLPETRAYKKFGFDRLSTKNSSLIEKTLRQIQKWSTSSPAMSTRIANALLKLPVYYTKFQVRTHRQNFYLPKNTEISESDLSLAALYVKDFGVFIEKSKFDQVSESNQIALLIHESLRQMQLSYLIPLSNQLLQKLTAQIMTTPKDGQSLDVAEFMPEEIFNSAANRQQLIIKTYEFVDSACKNEITEMCPMLDLPGPFNLDFVRSLRESRTAFEKRFYASKPVHINKKVDVFISEGIFLNFSLITQIVEDALDASEGDLFELTRLPQFYPLDMALEKYNSQKFFSLNNQGSANFLRKVTQHLNRTGFFY